MPTPKLLESAQSGATSPILKTEIHPHRLAGIRTINWSMLWGTSTTWSSEAVNKGRWLHPIQYDRKQQGTINGESFWKLRISNQINLAIFITKTKKMYCQPITSYKGNSSHPCLEIFHIPNLVLTLPETKPQLSVPLDNTNNMQQYISSILDTDTNHDSFYRYFGLTQPDLVWSSIIKKQGWNSTPIKIAKAVKCMGSSYEGESEAKK